MVPLGLQVYSVRDELASDYNGVLQAVAGMGYATLEMAGNYGAGPAETAALLKGLGVSVPSMHVPLPVGADEATVLKLMQTFGARYMICAYIPPDEFATRDQVLGWCDKLTAANAVAQREGLIFAYHNHWWEFETHEYGRPFDIMLQNLPESMMFELDAYWAVVGGSDAIQVLTEHGARIPLLHVKDGRGPKEGPMLAVGAGMMDYPALFKAATQVKWAFVEIDRCDTDMLEAVGDSARYLIEKGLLSAR